MTRSTKCVLDRKLGTLYRNTCFKSSDGVYETNLFIWRRFTIFTDDFFGCKFDHFVYFTCTDTINIIVLLQLCKQQGSQIVYKITDSPIDFRC